ncbi:MAG: uracil-DNA glycosylase family protein [Proteobacteria bacterium]|nr:uracil-DNA glycosylase family protein [Pseudomonadota bacterium]
MHDPFEKLLADIRACTACQGKGNDLPLGPRPILQAGQGARILIVGQAPGRITHAKGRPFDDASGARLRGWLGVDRETFYDPACFAIIPMGFCYPGTGKGGDMPPRPECATLWRAPLLSALPEIEFTILLGEYAHRWHFARANRPIPPGGRLVERVRAWREGWPRLIALPHPSPRNIGWFRNNPFFDTEILPELRARIAGLLGRSDDGAGASA